MHPGVSKSTYLTDHKDYSGRGDNSQCAAPRLSRGGLQRWQISMPIQAFVDDSGSHSDSPVLILGGFVADQRQWVAFADEWQIALDLELRLAYFKMSEAASLVGQFQPNMGWDIESVISDSTYFSRYNCEICQAKDTRNNEEQRFSESIKNLPAPRRSLSIDRPFSILANQLILAVAISADLYGITDPCDFIFDEADGFSAEFLTKWPAFKQIADQQPEAGIWQADRLSPIFGNREKVSPITSGRHVRLER